jgi:hypothetical protein
VHAARPPETQDFWPCVQLSLHVVEHMAFGARPEQDWGIVQGDVAETYRQPSVSVVHVAIV